MPTTDYTTPAIPEKRQKRHRSIGTTAAMWEYACRAGTTGDRYGDLDSIAWFYGWLNGNSKGRTHPVGQKQPDAWGLYDMIGHVSEWCLDCYGDYPQEPVTDPSGPESGEYRILRGGSWLNDDDACRAASRFYCPPDIEDRECGFRVARSSL